MKFLTNVVDGKILQNSHTKSPHVINLDDASLKKPCDIQHILSIVIVQHYTYSYQYTSI